MHTYRDRQPWYSQQGVPNALSCWSWTCCSFPLLGTVSHGKPWKSVDRPSADFNCIKWSKVVWFHLNLRKQNTTMPSKDFFSVGCLDLGHMWALPCKMIRSKVNKNPRMQAYVSCLGSTSWGVMRENATRKRQQKPTTNQIWKLRCLDVCSFLTHGYMQNAGAT